MSKREVEEEGFVKWFSELSSKDVNVAGGKGASLAEMYNNNFPIPPGFMVTAQAYAYFVEKAGLVNDIKEIIDKIDVNDTRGLEEAAKEIREIITSAELPEELREVIKEAYEVLDVDKKSLGRARGSALEILKNSHEPPFVAVRSSATAEDLADASFAGQQESFLNVKGEKELLEKVKKCFASLFTARAVYYRAKKGFEHSKVNIAVVVQKMVDSEKSGVMFSTNPVKNDGSILIEAVWGLGEGIVSGRIKPDQYIVDSDLENFKILKSEVALKKEAIVRDSSGENKIVKLNEEKATQQVLNSYEVKRLAQYARQLEEHYQKPQDIEFAIEGEEIYIVQSRPVTTKSSDSQEEVSGEVLLSGLGASPGIGSGVVKIVNEMKDLNSVKKGDVLVTKMTNPDMVVAMQRASAIITDEGGVTSHAAIVSREMGIPAVVGTGEATNKLKDGDLVTVDGNSGKIVAGKGETKAVEVKQVVQTNTKIKVIVDLPDYAERAAKSGVKGVGLTRIEGIIATSGKHPIAYVKEKKVRDYVDVLVKGLKKIAEPFEEVWIRTSDIRSDEFRNLKGSVKEIEGNPMLGDHGIRFSLKNREIIEAELSAAKELADDFPNKKFGVMVPQLISVEELKETKKIANAIGMPNNIKIGIMVETPAAVQIINELCEEGIDFISFGTNDLTQYTLAIDRNNSEVQEIYDEMNPAVLNSISYVLRRCRKYGVETSICGQAGSKENMVKFLVENKIDSISVNADAAEKISKLVAQLESGKEMDGGKEFVAAKTNREAEDVDGSDFEGKEKVPVAPITASTQDVQDIEETILKELDSENPPEGEDEYSPGDANGDDEKKEVPALNDAIPIDDDEIAKGLEVDMIKKLEKNESFDEKKEWKSNKVSELF